MKPRCRFEERFRRTLAGLILVVTHPFGTVIFALVSTVQVRCHPTPAVVAKVTKRFTWIAVIEVAAPSLF
jgi:hypothetical protein